MAYKHTHTQKLTTTMLEEELDEDAHFCIKCQTTIVGLDNYVLHRKSNCMDKGSNRDIIHTEHSYQTFDFSESAKDDEKSFHFNYDIDGDDHHDVVDSSADVITMDHSNDKSDPSKSLSKSYDYDYGLGADFFPYLNLQSSSKTKRTQQSCSDTNSIEHSSKLDSHTKMGLRKSATSTVLSHHTDPDDDWIDTPSTSGTDKLMNAVRAISGTKSHAQPTSIYNYGFAHDSPEPSDDDDDGVEDDDYSIPPRTHTGGKWKPSERSHRTLLQNSSSRWYERWDLPEDSHHDSLITHGSNEDFINDDCYPPPGHTKGKWVPGTKIIKLDYKADPEPEKMFSEQYWCNSCNRKLSSRSIYERHLKSNLHLKRSQPETELEEATFPLPRIEDIVKKRVCKPSVHVNENVYATRKKRRKKKKSKKDADESQFNAKMKRKRRCYYINCGICKTRLRENLFGKHLISHYHYRRMSKNPDESAINTILRNMHRIVIQSPYQCQPCRFYANTEECFMRHWTSADHLDVTDGPGRFWCNFCKFECEDNNQMRRHLAEIDHQEVVRAINRSVPIIIRKRTIIACDKCHEEFQFNIELKKHAEMCTRSVAAGTASNVYQDTHRCFTCGMTFKSTVAYQRHRSKVHSNRMFFCRPCSLTFENDLVARKHRTSAEHKIKVARLAKKGNLKRKCPVCGEIVADILLLKEHLKTKHPNDNYPYVTFIYMPKS